MQSAQSNFQKHRSTPWVLRLYVRGGTGKTQEALRNLKALCDQRLAGRYELEVIDIEQDAYRAAEDGVIAVPMLVRLEPKPVRRIIGNLSDSNRLAFALDIRMDEPPDIDPEDKSFST